MVLELSDRDDARIEAASACPTAHIPKSAHYLGEKSWYDISISLQSPGADSWLPASGRGDRPAIPTLGMLMAEIGIRDCFVQSATCKL